MRDRRKRILGILGIPENTYFIISKVIAEKARIWRILGNSKHSGNSKDSGILGILGIPEKHVFYNFESDRRKTWNMENIGKF